MRYLSHALIVGVLVCTQACPASNESHRRGVPAVGNAVADYTAIDCHGARHRLSELSAHKIVVLAFIGVDCPLAKLYAPRLASLAKSYESKGVAFVGVDSNRQDAISRIAVFARQSNLDFPILKDLQQRIADSVGATRTPEVVVLDGSRRIRYRGRIDDQYGFNPTNRAADYHRIRPMYNDLETAIGQLLANQSVSRPETEATGCLIGRDRQPIPHSDVTYAKDIAPLLNRKCVVCHRSGQIGPFPLTDYEEAAGWADMIAEVTESNRMPPWHADSKYGKFANDARLSTGEKTLFAKWAEAGAPRGDLNDLPSHPHFADGWLISKPDAVYYMSEQSFAVKATGVVEYQNFVVDPDWREDRWLAAVEPRPGNPSVVHHILVFVIPPGGSAPTLRSDDLFVGCYTPGVRPVPLPEGLAFRGPAGSKLFFEIHYTPNGVAQSDRSCVGIKYADPHAVRREVTVCSAFNTRFEIPPGAPDYEVRSQYVFNQDSLLLTLMPHMHLRGKRFLYEMTFPDGKRETLLSVPNYDFGWQTYYRLAEPRLIPKGSVLNCVAHYDNSEENLNNPDPKAYVRWGNQTYDEMMHGLFEIAPAQEGVFREPLLFAFHQVPFSSNQILAVVLTTINVAILGVLGFRMLRTRKSRSR
jgi:peroxiredoxin